MQYMLDTNICIFVLRNKLTEQLNQRLISIKLSDIVISAITLAELEVGVQKSYNSVKAEEKLQLFIAPFDILPFEIKDTRIYARVRNELERSGTPIGPLDTLIASHALSNGLTIITNNVREFSRVKGLKVEDWT